MEKPAGESIRATYWPRFLRSRRLMLLFDALRDRWDDRVERQRFAKWPHPDGGRRLLAVRTRGLGDVLQVSVLFDRIRKRYGVETLDLATSAAAVVVLKADTRVDEILPIGQLSAERLAGYDLIINFHIFDNSPEVRQALAGIGRERILGRTYGDNADYSWLETASGGCWLRKYARIAGVESFPDDITRMKIPRWPEWSEAQARSLRRLGLDTSGRFVGLCMGGADWRRNYPIELLGKLIGLVEKKYRAVVVGLSGDRPPHERALIAPMLEAHPRAVNLVDRLGLEDLLYVVDACKAFITCDTGPLHMALGLGTPLLALFGHIRGTEVFGPVTRSAMYSVVTTSCRCAFCGYRFRRSCYENRQAQCMGEFDLGEISAELDRLCGAGRP